MGMSGRPVGKMQVDMVDCSLVSGKSRVGNLPLLGFVAAKILSVVEKEWKNARTLAWKKRVLAMCRGYIATTYVYSLRGNEGFWVDADRLKSNIELG